MTTTHEQPWLSSYPPTVAPTVPAHAYTSLAHLLQHSCTEHADKTALLFMGHRTSFRTIDQQAETFAAYLQSMGLRKGERCAIMMPNVPQYAVAVAGILKAGLVVVNTNPLYTPRELQHQLTDSGAKAILILENMAATLTACIKATAIEHVVVTSVGEGLPGIKGRVVDFVLRHVKKLVPAYALPGSVRWPAALARGAEAGFTPVDIALDDIAVLQYTGGTTGVSKGAVLLNRNIIANVLQSEAWNAPAVRRVPQGEQLTTICALPLYHIFGFTVNLMLSMRLGGCNVLIPNPRDLPATIKVLKSVRFHSFPAVNTLFAAIARHPAAASVDWSGLRLSVGGGMAVQAATAKLWKDLTGTTICEGYGLSETSPSASCNPVDATDYSGTIGLPLPSTAFKIIDDEGTEVAYGERGEIAIRGPQVMAGYWNRPDETARVMTADGFFKSGDIGIMNASGTVSIVDRKKDMINVSGFNVYPNEIEDVVAGMKGVVEAAVVGVPDEMSGEAVKLYVVSHDPAVTTEAVRAFCRENLTGYKRPKHIAFRDELPKSNVGKVLRRMLRDE